LRFGVWAFDCSLGVTNREFWGKTRQAKGGGGCWGIATGKETREWPLRNLGFGDWGLGFGVWGLGFGVWGLGFGVWGLGFGV
jgi:hypothetical protein